MEATVSLSCPVPLQPHYNKYNIETVSHTVCTERFCDVDCSGLDDLGPIPGRG
jgi:hypothetical protein